MRPTEAQPAFVRAAAVAAVGLALYATLCVSSMATKSSTYDEAAHLPAGYANLRFHDYRLTPDHTPLVRSLAAVPLLFMDVRFERDDEAWSLHRPWELGKRFLYRWNDADRLLFWGRVPIVLLGATLCLLVFLWALRLFGLPAASLALLLAVLSPDMLAHGQVVTTDMGAALFVFASVASFERLAERLTWPRLLTAGFSVGAAFASKHSAAVLVPVLGLLALVVVWRAAPLPSHLCGRRSLVGRPVRAGALLLVGAVMVVCSVLVVWASYSFQFPMSPDPALAASYDWGRVHEQREIFEPFLLWARQRELLPESYLYGFLRFLKHSGSRPAFQMGQHSDAGWWYFFPFTFAVKTPIPLILLLAFSLLRWRGQVVARTSVFLWTPVVVYLALTFSRNLNIGHRHLLPVYPFLFIIAGRAATLLYRPLLTALAAWYLGSAVFIYPHYLAYFNELVGGPRQGYRYLVDSSLDWGQDLKTLKRYLTERGIPRIRLSYFGTGDPEYYGIPCDLLPGFPVTAPAHVVREVRPGDIVAVSATNLQEVYLDDADKPLMRRLRALQPLDEVGYSMLVYRADFSWP